MSVQLDRIKTLLATMFRSNNNNSEALDEGIRSISNFSGVNDLVNSIAIEANYYKVRGASADTFLLERCGINLNNDDFGAITGADAGGVLKTKETVVPEDTSVGRYPTSDTSRINGVDNLIVKWPSNIVESLKNKIQSGTPISQYTAMERIVYGLCSWWISESVKLVEESTGGNFSSSGNTWTMSVNFVSGKNYLGQMGASWSTTTYPSGKTEYKDTNLALRLNMDHCGEVSTDASGYMKGQGEGLDLTIAHEMTHAVLNACLKDKHTATPIWFKEGMAMVVEGGDGRANDIRVLASDTSALLSGLHSGDYYLGNSYEYAAGYMALRYLAHSGGSPAAGSTFMESSQAYYSDNLSTLIAKGNISGEVWLDNQHGTVFASSVNHIDASACNGYNNILAGNAADNWLISGSGSASLWGGTGGNDNLVGGSGTDMFWYGNGEGVDTIQNSSSIDTVMLYSPMNFESIGMSGNDLQVGIGGGNGFIIKDWNGSSSVNTFQLWDGSRWGLHKNENGGIDAYRK